MRLSPNTCLAHFEIVKLLGVGGMGEVYLAKDTKLHRKVAVKLLSEALCENKEYLRRFMREAKSASALNHPNIVTIYEVGTCDETQCFTVMEFIEGSNLRQLLDKRKIKLRDSLDAAIQVASALAAAHAAGIVHRDIKPENIIRRPDGLVKVLDFGLAKQLTASTGSGELDTEAVTQEKISIIPGLIMGTVQYMSPEQIRGSDVDGRTDIWSLGVVLYEMLAGAAPFTGKTNSDVMAAILKNEPPPLLRHKPNVPIELEHIIKKTLGKDFDERYQSIRDLLLDLKIFRSEIDIVFGISDSGSFTSVSETRPPARPVITDLFSKTGHSAVKNRSRLAILTFILLLTVGLSLYWRNNQTVQTSLTASHSASQITSWKSDLGEAETSDARFSPDGKIIVYTRSKNGSSAIWLKQLGGGGEPFAQKQDNAAERSPLWSPDGERIAYFSERGGRRGIWTSPTFGGSPILLAPLNAPGQQLTHWSKDGALVHFEMKQNLYALDVATKQITKLTDFDESQSIRRGFRFSPDATRIVYADRKNGRKDLWIADKRGQNAALLTDDDAEDSDPVWHPDGQRIIYSSNRGGMRQICAAFLDGRAPAQLTSGDSDSLVSDVSPDGAKILYTTTKDDSDLWSARLNTGKESQLTSDIGAEFWQDAAPDGETIIYQAVRTPSVGLSKLLNSSLLSQKTINDGGQIQLTDDGFNSRWSPDGSQLAFLRSNAGNNSLWITSAAGGDARRLTDAVVVFGGFSKLPFNRFQTQDYQWSLDGRSLIYCASRAGISNIWQTPTDETGEKQLTDNEDKSLRFFNPLLSPDNKSIVWLSMSASEPGKLSWSIWILTDGKSRQIYHSNTLLGLVGWSPEGAVIIKSVGIGTEHKPAEVNMFQLTSDTGTPKEIARLKETFFQSIQLSPDRETIAFVAKQDGSGVIQTLPLKGGKPKTVVSGSDARVYFSSLSFARDGKTFYYSKQANWQVISFIDNFK